jgi:hypothetical protein
MPQENKAEKAQEITEAKDRKAKKLKRLGIRKGALIPNPRPLFV